MSEIVDRCIVALRKNWRATPEVRVRAIIAEMRFLTPAMVKVMAVESLHPDVPELMVNAWDAAISEALL